LQLFQPARVLNRVFRGNFTAGLKQFAHQGKLQFHGAPVLPCTAFDAVPIGEKVRYRIPVVPNARRFRAGHKIRLLITTDDQDKNIPTPLEFRHASIGTSSFNTIFSSSRLLLPLLK
jgi:uncharacterized protein